MGSKWAHKFKAGTKFSIQPALNYRGTLWALGYSYEYIGCDATYVVISREVMEMNYLAQLARVAQLLPVEEAKKQEVNLHNVNTKDIADPVAYLKKLRSDKLYDDIFVFAPVKLW